MNTRKETIALLSHNIRIVRMLWMVGCLMSSVPGLFILLFGTALDGRLPVGFMGWISIGPLFPFLATLIGAELYGRDATDGSTLFFMALPISRFRRVLHRTIALILVLVSWFVIHATTAFALGICYGLPARLSWHDIVAITLAFHSSAMACASIAAVTSDRTANLISAIVLGLTVPGLIFIAITATVERPYWPMSLIFFPLGLAILPVPFLYHSDVEVDKV